MKRTDLMGHDIPVDLPNILPIPRNGLLNPCMENKQGGPKTALLIRSIRQRQLFHDNLTAHHHMNAAEILRRAIGHQLPAVAGMEGTAGPAAVRKCRGIVVHYIVIGEDDRIATMYAHFLRMELHLCNGYRYRGRYMLFRCLRECGCIRVGLLRCATCCQQDTGHQYYSAGPYSTG